MAGAMFLPAACGSPQSNSSPPQTAASAPASADGGLTTSAPSRKGLMVPSDTGIGSGATGTPTSTGTNGKAIGPTLGSPGN